jgi:hypothetical protein
LSRIAVLTQADLAMRWRTSAFRLVLLAVAVASWWCFPPRDADYALLTLLGRYRGIYSSAWMGSTVAMTTIWLALVGFFCVRGGIVREAEQGVWPLLASAPLNRREWLLSKWLGNLLSLALIVAAQLLVALLAQWLRAEDRHIDLLALILPVVWLSLPMLSLVSALAVGFELLPGLRGTAGNVVYFMLWILLLATTEQALSRPLSGPPAWPGDPAGEMVFERAEREATAGLDKRASNARFCMVCGVSLGQPLALPWPKLAMVPEQALGRISWGLLPPVILLLCTPLTLRRPRESRRDSHRPASSTESWPARLVDRWLGSLALLEIGIAWRGRPGWWWAGLLLAWCAEAFAPASVATAAHLAAWLLILATLSKAALRERDSGLLPLVDSTPNSAGLLPARWLAISLLAAWAVLPAIVRSAIGHDGGTAAALLLAGPSLAGAALVSGLFAQSARPFELLFCWLAYLALHGNFILDPAAAARDSVLLHLVAIVLCAAILHGHGQLRRRRGFSAWAGNPFFHRNSCPINRQ